MSNRIIALVAGLLAIAALAFGASKPKISITFSLKEKGYRLDLDKDTILAEREGTALLRELFGKYLGFADFSDSVATDSLIVILDDQEAGATSELREVGFTMTLKGSHLSAEVPYYWRFRSQEAFRNVTGQAATFLHEMQDTLENRFSLQKDNLVDSVFSKLQISDTALALRETHLFVVPYQPEHLALANRSEFMVRCIFLDPSSGEFERDYRAVVIGIYNPSGITVTGDFFRGIKAEAEDQAHLSDVEKNIPMSAKGLYLKKYVPLPLPPLTPSSPDSTSFGQ